MNTPRRESGAGKAQDNAYKTSSFNPQHVARLEAAMSWDEAAKNVQREMGLTDEKPFRGINDVETQLGQRIARYTFTPANDNNVRQQQAINEHLKQQAAQLREDLARQRKYEADLKAVLAREKYLA